MPSHNPNDKHKGYYQRKKAVPHFDQAGLTQVITFRLADSLPAHALAQMITEAKQSNDAEKRKRLEQLLDAGHGECYLAAPEIAELVQNALLFFDIESIENMRSAAEAGMDEGVGTDTTSVNRNGRYRLIAWVIMPNHVHVMIELLEGHPMDKIVQSWKSFTAKKSNNILERSGQFWAEDYFDRFIRDQTHFNNAIRYIHHNPVKAGLVTSIKEWAYSSVELFP